MNSVFVPECLPIEYDAEIIEEDDEKIVDLDEKIIDKNDEILANNIEMPIELPIELPIEKQVETVKVLIDNKTVEISKEEYEKHEEKAKGFECNGRAFHIVIHQAIKDKLDLIIAKLESFQQFQYILVGEHQKETSKKGLIKPPHWHIYVQYRNNEKFWSTELFGAHIAKCRASAQMNIKYIKCQDDHERHKNCKYKKYYEKGFPKYRGGHISTRDIIERWLEDPNSIYELDYRYYNVVQKIINDYDRKNQFAQWRKNVLAGKKSIEVEWHVGLGGTGKTYAAALDTTDNDAMADFTKDGNFANTLGDVEHAHTLILNEFKDSGLDFKTFLALLTNEKVINIKGSQVYPQYLKKIIITSQQYPHQIYQKAGEDRTQISRRIDKIIVHSKDNEFKTLTLDNEKYWNQLSPNINDLCKHENEFRM